jgi:hypothetical protein
MKTTLLIAAACLLALFSTIGASLPYPILPPLFASGQLAVPRGIQARRTVRPAIKPSRPTAWAILSL